MANASASVVIRGSTVAGAACASVLARSGVPVRVDSPRMPSGIAMVSRGVLGALQIPGSMSTERITRVINRQLLEDDATDRGSDVNDIHVVHRSDVVSALLGGAAGATSRNDDAPRADVILIDARDRRLGETQAGDLEDLGPADINICSYLSWAGVTDKGGQCIRLTGESLSDVKAHARIVAGLATTILVLVVPMAMLVETSIALPDVLSRLLAHPAVTCELPGGEPNAVYTRLLSTTKRSLISLRERIELRIGLAAGRGDPIILDAELQSGMIAGEHVAAAVAEDRLSIARLSRIAREFSRVESIVGTAW